MKNNKGFTLIELLAVLIILVVIFSIVFMSASGMLDDGKGAIYKAEEKVVFDATNSFLKVKANMYPPMQSNKYCITFSQLIDYGYLTDNQILTLTDKFNTVLVTYDSSSSPEYKLTNECEEVKVNSNLKLAGSNTVIINQQPDGQNRTYEEKGLFLYEEGSDTPTQLSFSLEDYSSIPNLQINATSLKHDDTTPCTEERYCINETVIDTYTITYKYKIDSSTSLTAERIVKVLDREAPVINISGQDKVIFSTSVTSYDVKSGVSATDNSGENIRVNAKTDLKLGQEGTYSILYTATDSSGNTSTKTRTVVITKTGSLILNVSPQVVNINVGDTYTQSDILTGIDIEGSGGENLIDRVTYTIRKNNQIITSIDTSKVGNNIITYEVEDNSGVKYTANRVVNVNAVEETHTLKTYLSSLPNTSDYSSYKVTSDFHNSAYESKIMYVNFLRGATVPDSPVASWDLSKDGDNSIIGWLEEVSGNTSYYTLNITSSGKIYAPEKSILWFADLTSVESYDFTNFYTDKVTDMSYMFKDNTSIEYLDLSSFNTSKVNNLYGTFVNLGFNDVSSFTLNLSSWDTARVRDMTFTFSGVGLKSNDVRIIGLDGFRTNNVLNMTGTFYSFAFLAPSIDLSGISSWNTSNVTNMTMLFQNAASNASSINLDISGWNTSKVTNMSYMFTGFGAMANSFTINPSSWDVTKVTNMSYMFQNTKFSSIDLTGWSTVSLTNTKGMFDSITSSNIYVGPNWDVTSVDVSDDMFKGATNLPNYNSASVNKSKAFVGEGGYLSSK